MIESVQFKNFKVLRDTTLPLGPFTVIVGPNGSGKSSALQALVAVREPAPVKHRDIVSVSAPTDRVEVLFQWDVADGRSLTQTNWEPTQQGQRNHRNAGRGKVDSAEQLRLNHWIARIRLYQLDPVRIAQPVTLESEMDLDSTGWRLPGVLDRLRDKYPERFEALNAEFGRCLPEFDRVLFDTPQTGFRGFELRTRAGRHRIRASDLSQGTLLALAVLTVANLPDPPSLVAFEEPDRGIHPRLLADVRDALYRLAYPQQFGEVREPVQVIATTHSPYFLDLFRDHPEEIVVAEKVGLEAKFTRLTDRPDIEEILADTHLGDAWYSGILGGVPVER